MFWTPKKIPWYYLLLLYHGVGTKNRNYVYTIREPPVFTPFNCRGNKCVIVFALSKRACRCRCIRVSPGSLGKKLVRD